MSWLQAIHARLRDLQYDSDHREEGQSIQCAPRAQFFGVSVRLFIALGEG